MGSLLNKETRDWAQDADFVAWLKSEDYVYWDASHTGGQWRHRFYNDGRYPIEMHKAFKGGRAKC